MERHFGISLPCRGFRPSGEVCGTQILIALDVGPSAFRCPVCDTIYVVDPLQAGSPLADQDSLICMEFPGGVQGHTVEIFTGELVHMIHDSYDHAAEFYLPKLGTMQSTYVAQANLGPQEIVKAEVEHASRYMEDYRPGKPFTLLEQSLGLMAFANWLRFGKPADLLDASLVSHSARSVAVQFVEEVLSEHSTVNAIRAQVPAFDPRKEVLWARHKAHHPDWQASITRAVVMLCRGLAYRYTGALDTRSELLHQLTPDQIAGEAARLYRRATS